MLRKARFAAPKIYFIRDFTRIRILKNDTGGHVSRVPRTCVSFALQIADCINYPAYQMNVRRGQTCMKNKNGKP